MPGPFDGGAQSPLVFGTDTGLARWLNFGAAREIPAQSIRILIIDGVLVCHAKRTDATPGGISAPGARSGASRGARPAPRIGGVGC